jgi:hypothetical protein
MTESTTGDTITSAIQQRVDDEFKKIEQDARTPVEERMTAFEKFEKESRERFEERLRRVEERVTRDVRTKVFSVASSVVIVAAGVMLVGSFAATREVNNSVIALQKDIIAAQTAIKSSSDSLLEQKGKVADAQAQLRATISELGDARKQLDAVTSGLEKARVTYESLSRETRALQQKARN